MFHITITVPPSYGSRLEIQGGDFYYTSTVTEKEALRIRDLLVKNEFFGTEPDSGKDKSLQFRKIDSKFQLAIPTDDASLMDAIDEVNSSILASAPGSDPSIRLELQALSKTLSRDFKRPVSVLLCNTELKNCHGF